MGSNTLHYTRKSFSDPLSPADPHKASVHWMVLRCWLGRYYSIIQETLKHCIGKQKVKGFLSSYMPCARLDEPNIFQVGDICDLSPDFTKQAVLQMNLTIAVVNQASESQTFGILTPTVASRYFKKSTRSGDTYIHKVSFLSCIPVKASGKQPCNALKWSNLMKIGRPPLCEFVQSLFFFSFFKFVHSFDICSLLCV